MTDAPVAAIDMGTNSTRLLVHDGEHTIERLMTITRLGQDVDRTGRLADEAIERVLSCLRTYKSVMDQHGVTRVRAVATSAARDAANRDEFFTAVHDVIGVEPELLAGFDEGKLSFRGATADLDPADGPFLMIDIEHDPPRPEELVACLSITEAHLDDVARQMPQIAHTATFVGLAGTVSTAAAVELGLAEYDRDQIHHFVLTKEAAEDVYRTLVTEARDDRIHNPGLEEARADVIVGGMCILVRIMRYFDIEELVVSEADILAGLVFSLVSPPSS